MYTRFSLTLLTLLAFVGKGHSAYIPKNTCTFFWNQRTATCLGGMRPYQIGKGI